jgi:hypothetical protein
VLALIQAVVDILVVVPAIFAFIWQMLELQSYPSLDLRCNIKLSNDTELVFLAVLTNSGNSVTSWYLVSFSIPEDLLKSLSDLNFTPIIGTLEQHWKIGHIRNSSDPPFVNFLFTSNGEIASYPNYDLFLARLHIRLHDTKEYKSSYAIRYVIVTWDLSNVLITPHTAGETRQFEDNVLDILVENLNRLWRGELRLWNEIV